jgi:hypothetical protein
MPSAWLAGFLTAVLFTDACARVDWLALAPPEGRTPAQVERDRQECEAEAKPSAGRLAEGAGEGLAIHFLAPSWARGRAPCWASRQRLVATAPTPRGWRSPSAPVRPWAQ